MSFDVIQRDGEKESSPKLSKRREKFRVCLQMCLKVKDRNVLVAAHGLFMVSLGVVLLVGRYAIKQTTTSTFHTKPAIPTVIDSALVRNVFSLRFFLMTGCAYF